jgi:hypothetical protein
MILNNETIDKIKHSLNNEIKKEIIFYNIIKNNNITYETFYETSKKLINLINNNYEKIINYEIILFKYIKIIIKKKTMK